ncbi:MAG: hypothetical protein ACTSPJ_02635 [Candidatus Heimdallarchaeaceae archaeon]
MKKFDIVATDNFILLQSGKTFVGIVGYAIICIDCSFEEQNKAVKDLVKLIIELNLSFTFHFEEKAVKIFFLISSSKTTDILNSVVKLESRISLLSNTSQLFLSPLNHKELSHKISSFYFRSVNKTICEKTFQLGDSLFTFFTFIPISNKNETITPILQRLVKQYKCKVVLSNRLKKVKNSDCNYLQGIIISKELGNEKKKDIFFNQFNELLDIHDPDCTILVRFFSAKEIEQNKIFFALGYPTIESHFDNDMLCKMVQNSLSTTIKKRVGFSTLPNS